MCKTIVASLVVLGLLVTAGCRTETSGRHHRGCHKMGVHSAGRNGVTHHHYARPDTPVEEKAK